MGLFSKKTPILVRSFCKDHYDRNFYPHSIQGVDPAEVFLRTVSKSIADVDDKFSVLDPAEVRRQMTLIRFEVFSLAWLHQLGNNHAADQSLYTRDYLFERNDQEAWEDLSGYNQGIAASATFDRSPDNGAGRAFIAMTNRTRADLFDEWLKKGFDEVVCARAANRSVVEVAWKSGTTAQFIAVEFANRTRYDWNKLGRERLEFVIRGFYDGARVALKDVKVAG